MKSSTRHKNFRQSSLSTADTRHSLLLAMAADVERQREQAKRIEKLRREKERRDGRAITQETAAYEIGVSSRTYRTWEGSGATLKFDNLKALADYYDTTTHYIETGVPERVETPTPFAVPTDAGAQILKRLDAIEETLRLLRAANEARALEVLERIEALLQPTQAPRRQRRS